MKKEWANLLDKDREGAEAKTAKGAINKHSMCMSEEEIRGVESSVWYKGKGMEESGELNFSSDSNKVSVQEIQFFKDVIILD